MLFFKYFQEFKYLIFNILKEKLTMPCPVVSTFSLNRIKLLECLFVVFWWEKKLLKALLACTFNHSLLNSFDLP